MPFQLPDSTIRAEIVQDVNAVLPSAVVNFGPPPPGTVPVNASVLPRWFINLRDPDIQGRNQGTATLGETSVIMEYAITLQELWPASGTIDELKVQRVNSLLAQLTDEDRYAGIGLLEIRNIVFDDNRVSTESEPFFEFTVLIGVEVVTTTY